MRAPLVVVTGTGTEIGKTHVASALLAAWGTRVRAAGLKPIETGVRPGEEGADGAQLRVASTFHVKPWPRAPFTFAPPVSPHLAAREAGVRIDPATIAAFVEPVRQRAEGVLVELAGGLFSPLGEGLANVDVARALEPDAVILIAPDRLGALHDVAAATLAARARGLALDAVVLSTPATADSSTGRNAAELRYVSDVATVAIAPRASIAELAAGDSLSPVVRLLRALRPRA